MSEQNPRKHDKVRVVLEGIVDEVVPPACVVTTSDRVRRPVPLSAVEVLERADDPSENEIGTVRREDYDAGHSAWQCVAASDPGATEWFCAYSTDPSVVGEVVDHSSVIDLPVIGAAPGTPAAEAEKPAPISSHESYCKDLAEAIYASHIYPWEELLFTARRYATHAIRDEQAAEKEDYPEVSGAGVPYPPADLAPPRDLCTVDECEAAPRCSSGATVWHDKTVECGNSTTAAAAPERQVPLEMRQAMAAALVAGDKVKAITIAQHWGMERDEALAYVEAMPEHDTYLNHWPAKTANEDGPLRCLLVHPNVWKPVVSYLESGRVRVVEVTAAGDRHPTYGMELMDGEWPGE